MTRKFGTPIELPGNPANALEAAPKQYVDLRQLLSEKGAASGYAGLDGSTKVPIAQIPTGTTSSTVVVGNDTRVTADQAAGTASIRTLGTGAAQACAGDDSRLSNSRAPSGSASGSLTGTYPGPTIAAGAVNSTEVATAIKDPTAATAGLRTLGTGAAQACAGDDARLNDSRAPSGTAGGVLNGTYPNPGLDLVPWAPVGLTDAATVVTDASLGNHFRVTITAARNIGTPTNPTNGQKAIWEITASGGAWVPTFATGSAGTFKFGTTITAAMITAIASGTTDMVGAIYNSTADRWYVVAYTKGF